LRVLLKQRGFFSFQVSPRLNKVSVFTGQPPFREVKVIGTEREL